MIKLEKTEVAGWEAAIRGMRNPMNSWERSDSDYKYASYHDMSGGTYEIGPNDLDLMLRLAKGGSVHAKYRRFITVSMDITAPLYWWKEFDTYRAGVTPNPMEIEMNSCSTMHKIHEKEFTLDDFSCEHLENCAYPKEGPNLNGETRWVVCMDNIISSLNVARQLYLDTGDKKYWWQMIQLLPSSYNQKRTMMLNYEALAGLYPMRKDHKLDEWRDFCKWIEELPYSEIITLEETDKEKAMAENTCTKACKFPIYTDGCSISIAFLSTGLQGIKIGKINITDMMSHSEVYIDLIAYKKTASYGLLISANDGGGIDPICLFEETPAHYNGNLPKIFAELEKLASFYCLERLRLRKLSE